MSDGPLGDDRQTVTTEAFEELQNNLEYARNLVRGGQHLERLDVRAFDVTDLYRAAWVQAVSAMDHWVHRELYDRALGFALNVDVERPKKFLGLEVPMSLFEDVHHHSKTLQQVFVEHLRSRFGYQSFQAPDKIKDALRYVSDAALWPDVTAELRRSNKADSQNAIISDLKQIVDRRNKIAHEADRDPERRQEDRRVRNRRERRDRQSGADCCGHAHRSR